MDSMTSKLNSYSLICSICALAAIILQLVTMESQKLHIVDWSIGYFSLGGILREERHFLLFKDQLAESGRQKIKENIIPRGKFLLVENDPNMTSLQPIWQAFQTYNDCTGYAVVSRCNFSSNLSLNIEKETQCKLQKSC